MGVTREQLEAQLAKLRAHVAEPRHGLFGPESMLWSVNREQFIFLAGGRTALLELAHPFVAHAIDRHSRAKSDPQGRLERTFEIIDAMIYGDLESALAAARRLHRVHDRIRGVSEPGVEGREVRYEANAEHALLWVHATIWDSSLQVYELLLHPLSDADKERYYQETKLFAYLFGISDAALPARYADFVAYNEHMWGSEAELSVTEAARRMARLLFTPPTPAQAPLFEWYRAMTAALLPPRIREGYELPYGPQERALCMASIAALRGAVRLMPRQLRFAPGYQTALERAGVPMVPTLAERWVMRHMLHTHAHNAA